MSRRKPNTTPLSKSPYPARCGLQNFIRQLAVSGTDYPAEWATAHYTPILMSPRRGTALLGSMTRLEKSRRSAWSTYRLKGEVQPGGPTPNSVTRTGIPGRGLLAWIGKSEHAKDDELNELFETRCTASVHKYAAATPIYYAIRGRKWCSQEQGLRRYLHLQEGVKKLHCPLPLSFAGAQKKSLGLTELRALGHHAQPPFGNHTDGGVHQRC